MLASITTVANGLAAPRSWTDLIRSTMRLIGRAILLRHYRRALRELPDYLLKDIGIHRCEIDWISAALAEGHDPFARPRRAK
jgi:uncharacterized protein YjiS (DUF1127 family)